MKLFNFILFQDNCKFSASKTGNFTTTLPEKHKVAEDLYKNSSEETNNLLENSPEEKGYNNFSLNETENSVFDEELHSSYCERFKKFKNYFETGSKTDTHLLTNNVNFHDLSKNVKTDNTLLILKDSSNVLLKLTDPELVKINCDRINRFKKSKKVFEELDELNKENFYIRPPDLSEKVEFKFRQTDTPTKPLDIVVTYHLSQEQNTSTEDQNQDLPDELPTQIKKLRVSSSSSDFSVDSLENESLESEKNGTNINRKAITNKKKGEQSYDK